MTKLSRLLLVSSLFLYVARAQYYDHFFHLAWPAANNDTCNKIGDCESPYDYTDDSDLRSTLFEPKCSDFTPAKGDIGPFGGDVGGFFRRCLSCRQRRFELNGENEWNQYHFNLLYYAGYLYSCIFLDKICPDACPFSDLPKQYDASESDADFNPYDNSTTKDKYCPKDMVEKESECTECLKKSNYSIVAEMVANLTTFCRVDFRSAGVSIKESPTSPGSPSGSSTGGGSSSSSKSSSLSTGAKAGIGIGVTLIVVVSIIVAWWVLRRHLQKYKNQPPATGEPAMSGMPELPAPPGPPPGAPPVVQQPPHAYNPPVHEMGGSSGLPYEMPGTGVGGQPRPYEMGGGGQPRAYEMGGSGQPRPYETGGGGDMYPRPPQPYEMAGYKTDGTHVYGKSVEMP